jgi:hypothetical protein
MWYLYCMHPVVYCYVVSLYEPQCNKFQINKPIEQLTFVYYSALSATSFDLAESSSGSG